MVCCGFLMVSCLFVMVVGLPKQELGVVKSRRIVSQEVDKDEDKSKDENKNLAQMMENKVLRQVVDDDTGKILPGEMVPGVGGVPHLPGIGKNFARRMSEAQWQQQHNRLHPKPFPEYKRVLHNRNTINDNRHDRKNMKLARHQH